MSGTKSKRNSQRRKRSKVSENGFSTFISVIPSMIPLVFKLGIVYLRFKRKAKRAGKAFKKELIKNGIDKETAKLLTEDYLRSSRVLRQFDFSDLMSEKKWKEAKAEYEL